MRILTAILFALIAVGGALMFITTTSDTVARLEPAALAWLVLGMVLAAAIWLALVLTQDRFRARRWWPMTIAFLLTATIAVGVGLLANGPAISWIQQRFGVEFAENFAASFAGAGNEEPLKAAAILATVVLFSRSLDRPAQLFYVGAAAGLGFAVVENLHYGLTTALTHADSDMAGVTMMVVARGITGLVMHWFWSACVGLGIGLLLWERGLLRRWIAGIATIALGWGLHFFWNAAGVLPGEFITAFVVSALVIVLVLAGLKRMEFRWFAERMHGEVSDARVSSMRSWWTRSRARRRTDATRASQSELLTRANRPGAPVPSAQA
ncbi:MAG: PrsW family intramembrane metalloprotease [Micrococcus sp.]|nr:PrsW family intramembrane metalloprotease [Micrococcus sp.]